ncbi:MAG: arylsulfatase [Planctomycetes bacterium]|nr:arylsulfatase [Planctomycetota bacterium]
MNKISVCVLAAFIALLPTPPAKLHAAEKTKPNILVILADDLGYGDVKCLNPDGKIPTPNLDKLAAAGMTFTDANTPSGVCSPTRYGVMTGRYAWRSKLKSGVLGGLSPRLIEPGRVSVAQFLKDSGYHTACVGKWHLGMDWQLKPDRKVTELGIEPREQVSSVEYDKPIKNGPNSLGFDYYFGISASLDMVPYTFIENDKVTANPTEDRDFAMMLGKEPGQRTRKGPAAPGFEAEDVLPSLTKKAVAYIGERAKAKTPFFLYLPLASPHTPIASKKDWQMKSGLNPYADFVMATDSAVGDVLAALKANGVDDNTLVIFTSDNGCSPMADFPVLLKLGHNPNYIFRGHKADIFEGGHRVPFFVSWPGKITPGSKTDRIVCLTDITATCAAAIGAKVPDDVAEDSISFASAWTTPKDPPARTGLVVQSVNGSFAIREGKWKLCLCPGSGGWSVPRPGSKDEVGLPAVQLYDLEADIAEKTNLEAKHPEIVARLTKQLEKFVADGRSTEGKPQKNTTPVTIRKK